jgi:hypothetical protein
MSIFYFYLITVLFAGLAMSVAAKGMRFPMPKVMGWAKRQGFCTWLVTGAAIGLATAIILLLAAAVWPTLVLVLLWQEYGDG